MTFELRLKDIGLLLLLQLLLPEVVPLQFVLHDVHAQRSDLVVGDQAVELGEAEEGEGQQEEEAFQLSERTFSLIDSGNFGSQLRSLTESTPSPAKDCNSDKQKVRKNATTRSIKQNSLAPLRISPTPSQGVQPWTRAKDDDQFSEPCTSPLSSNPP